MNHRLGCPACQRCAAQWCPVAKMSRFKDATEWGSRRRIRCCRQTLRRLMAGLVPPRLDSEVVETAVGLNGPTSISSSSSSSSMPMSSSQLAMLFSSSSDVTFSICSSFELVSLEAVPASASTLNRCSEEILLPLPVAERPPKAECRLCMLDVLRLECICNFWWAICWCISLLEKRQKQTNRPISTN